MRGIVFRIATIAGAYLATAAAVFAVILVLRGLVPAPRLREILGFYFIAALAAGLEPATVRAYALAHGAAPGPWSVLAAGAIKALAVSPVLALVWRIADAHAPTELLLLTPLICVAGFWATDARAALDLRGHHAAAVWLKQGGLAGGVLLLGAMVGLGAPVALAGLVSTAARLVPPLILAQALRQEPGPGLGALMRDPRWPALAAMSVIAAAGGSVDRVVALRFLPGAAYAGYALIYELFSRFWLFPYLATPILFARLAAGQGGGALMARAWRWTLLAGAAFVALVAGVALAAPTSAARLLGTSLGPPAIGFAAAVVIGALTQLRIAELQGKGAVRRAVAVTVFGTAVSALAFLLGVRALGLPGLLWAWLIKSAVEFGAAMVRSRDERAA